MLAAESIIIGCDLIESYHVGAVFIRYPALRVVECNGPCPRTYCCLVEPSPLSKGAPDYARRPGMLVRQLEIFPGFSRIAWIVINAPYLLLSLNTRRERRTRCTVALVKKWT